jgi:LSD1 subclass zinc finger protein
MNVVCPACERPLNVPEHMTGKQVRCPLCNAPFHAVAPSAVPAAVTPGAPPRERGFGPADEEAPSRAELLQRALNRGANRLLLAGIVFTAMGVSHVVIDLVLQAMSPTLMPLGVVTAIRVMIALFFVGAPAIFLFLGASLLRQVRIRGIVMTAAILAIIFACLYICGLLYLVISAVISTPHGGNRGLVVALTVVEGLLLLAAVVIGFIAGCGTIGLLGRPDVREAYGLPGPRRRPREPWDRPGYDEERWSR